MINWFNNKIEEISVDKILNTSKDIITQYGFTSKALLECIKNNQLEMFISSWYHWEDNRAYHEKFDWKFTTEIANALIEKKEYRIFFRNLKYFTDLDSSVLHNIIDNIREETLINELNNNYWLSIVKETLQNL